MRFIRFFSVVVLAGLLLAGCASVAHVEKDDSVNFSNYHTYSWVETKENRDDSSKTKVSDLTEQKMREAVNAEMAKMGWREVKHRPDALLSYDVLVERSVKDDASPVYSNPYTRYLYNPYSRRWVSVYYPSQFMAKI